MPAEATGGGMSFDQFFAAMEQQESGGNYKAQNGRTGALGLFQIMQSNIVPWGRQYLGRNITVDQYRQDSSLQQQLARAVLSDYFGKYGARGAAAKWYSGSENKANDYTKFRTNEPSVGQYVDQVLGRAGSASAYGTTPVSPSVTPQPEAAGDLAETQPQPLLDAISFHPNSLGFEAGASPDTGSGQPSLTQGVSYKPGAGSDRQRDLVISEAMKYIGTPYVWGGTSPNGFDCSGFTQFVLRNAAGIDLPRISAAQANFGRRVSLDQLRPGDLVALDNSGRNQGADHIALWLGNGQIIEAPHAGASVRVRSVGKNEGFWGVALNY